MRSQTRGSVPWLSWSCWNPAPTVPTWHPGHGPQRNISLLSCFETSHQPPDMAELPKTGLHSGYLMLYEVRYGKSIWVIKKVLPHFPYTIYFPLYYIWLFSILEILCLTFCNTGKSASLQATGWEITLLKKKRLWNTAMLISSTKRQQD